MGVVFWDKPPKAQSKEAHAGISFDGGPPGGYVPNMPKEYQQKWKGKIVGITTDSPQIELRKTFNGAQMLIIVSLGGGYQYKYYTREKTKGVNIHIALNSGAQLTFAQLVELHEAVDEAKEKLHTLNEKYYLIQWHEHITGCTVGSMLEHAMKEDPGCFGIEITLEEYTQFCCADDGTPEQKDLLKKLKKKYKFTAKV